MLTPEQIDANIAALLAGNAARRAQALERPREPQRPDPQRRGRPQTEVTKRRISNSLRQYHSRKLVPGEVRAARIAKQLTQAQAARLAGLKLSTYRDIERDDGASSRPDYLGRVRHVLEIDRV